LLAKIDRAMLASYCEAWAEYVESCEELRKVGRYYTSSNGNPLRHPLCQIRDNAADRCMRLADRFGMSPSARTRLARVEEEATDDFADAFGA
jgi:P27 family predicted phage terminase small subunit